MIAFAIRAVEVDDSRGIRSLIGTPIPDDDPDMAVPGLSGLGCKHRYLGVVAMQMGRCQRRSMDQFGDRAKLGDRRSCPADQGRAGDVDAKPGEYLALAVQRQMVIEFRDQDVAEKVGAGHASLDRGRRG